jgi:hypothetical protein
MRRAYGDTGIRLQQYRESGLKTGMRGMRGMRGIRGIRGMGGMVVFSCMTRMFAILFGMNAGAC